MSTIFSADAARFWWKMEVPKNVAYYHRDFPHEKWKTITYEDIKAKKIERQQRELCKKRDYSKRKQAAFIWVFCNYNYDFFGGWYIYLKTCDNDYPLNFRYHNKELILKIMQIFPCGVIPCNENFVAWCTSFAKQFHRKAFKRKSRQGILPIWIEFDEQNRIVNIIPENTK